MVAMNVTKRLLHLASIPLFVSAVACGGTADDTASEDQDIVDSPQSSVKNQEDTGNCWLYATTAWAESLNADPATGKAKDYSTDWLVYWNFYEQIVGAQKGFTGVDWTGGSWGEAAELIQRYGLVELPRFTGLSNEDADAKLALEAQKTLNESLKRGALHTKAARQDRKLVRQELNRAFHLDADLVAAMDLAFGEDGQTTFTSGAEAPDFILAPKDVRVRLPMPNGTSAKFATLADAIGQRGGDKSDAGNRIGRNAWSAVALDDVTGTAARKKAMRAYLKRVQRALHDDVPVPVSWCVEDPGADDSGAYTKPLTGIQDADCAHETLITDYEVVLPSGKVLKAGEDASPEDEAAALDDAAVIKFIRVKNSWGVDDSGKKHGYTDISLDYLMSSISACPDKKKSKSCVDWSFLIDEVTLPPGY